MNWIQPSNTLPDENEFVLVTMRYEGERYINIAMYRREIDMETGEVLSAMDFFDGEICLNKNGFKVTAWMPLPEPYKDKFRVIVAGTRTFDDYKLLEEKLDKIFKNHRPTSIVCGEAKGADTLGKEYAKKHNIHVDSFPANWEKYGKQAGYIRNEEMAKNAEALIAFHKDNSAGTKHMIETAKKNNLQIRVIKV